MRTPPFLLAAFLLPLGAARADNSVDVSTIKDKMKLVSDGKNHFVAFVPFDRDDDRVFYGDGKTFYALPLQGGGRQGDVRFDVVFVDPRHPRGAARSFDYDHGKYSVTCGDKTTPLALVDEARQKQILDGARWEKSPRKRKAYALARDTRGNYYYVDTGRTEETAKAFKLYVGPKGALKLQKMTNVVSDSEGDIFSTKTGSLRLILSKNQSTWIERKKQQRLTIVPVEDNLPMIYGELGVYTGERLGTPCDDF